MNRPKGFLDLPNELLLMIREELDPVDLLSNACYYLLCSRTRACYKSMPESAWDFMLRACGMGPSSEEEVSTFRWKDVALECAEHAWCCQYPGCGVTQITWNMQYMQKELDSRPGWDFLPILHNERPAQRHWLPAESPVFAHVSFNDNYSHRYRAGHPNGAEDNIEDIAYLQLPARDSGARAWIPEDLLRRHPVAARSFATVPPSQQANLSGIADLDDVVFNVRGVTVRDVLSYIGSDLDRSLTTEEIALYMIDIGDVDMEPLMVPESWSLRDTLCALSDLGDWFKLVDWDLMIYGDPYDPMPLLFNFYAKPEVLPPNVDAHRKRYEAPDGLL